MLTENHPDSKSYPRVVIEHQHQINVDENANCGEKWNQWNLKEINFKNFFNKVKSQVRVHQVKSLLDFLPFAPANKNSAKYLKRLHWSPEFLPRLYRNKDAE